MPLDFDWPLNKVWSGFLLPDELGEETCAVCDGSGYSGYARMLNARWYGHIPFDPAETGSKPYTTETPEVRAFAERNLAHSPQYYGTGFLARDREARRLADLFNSQWSHHLDQTDVDALVESGRLVDFTHTWVKGDGWQPIEPVPTVTPEQVNAWSMVGFGHDSINASIVVRARCERDGQPVECADCGGHGSREKYEGQRAEAEAWEAAEPPTGDGWQLWETTSEGSPISPVFPSGDELAEWMSQNPCGFAKARIDLDTARSWVHGSGWSPSMIGGPTGVTDGITAMTEIREG